MAKFRFPSILLLFVLVLAIGREGRAVIYKYIDEQGGILFVDDLQKIPEQKRSSAVMVSGADASPEPSAEERARAAAMMEAARQEQAASRARNDDAFRSRLILSLCGGGAVIVLLFVTGHLGALRQRPKVLKGARTGLIAALVAFLSVAHFTDIARMFRKAGDTGTGVVSDIQVKQAARGKKAAEAMNALNALLEHSSEDARQREKQIEEAERGR